jgi:hypothetical protein
MIDLSSERVFKRRGSGAGEFLKDLPGPAKDTTAEGQECRGQDILVNYHAVPEHLEKAVIKVR